ncbi:MAG TPA: protein kinase, partial [Myxococcales bacterium]|nr:protein kinase [Myxococcales bacterium]
QVCRALGAAHAAGIIHRDLKPENIILVAREGQAEFVKVLDFGISKMTERPTGERLTQQGMIVGTPEYMSPEQGSASPVDARSDIYSLGVMMFEMLTGKLPFQGENALQILMRHQTQPVPRLTDAAPDLDLPPAAEAFVQKALAKQPYERQQSMPECLAELQICAGQVRMTMPAIQLPPDVTGLTPTDPIMILATPAPMRIPSRPPASYPPPEPLRDTVPSVSAPSTAELAALRPRHTGLWIGLALILVAGGVAALVTQKRGPAPEPPLPVPPAVVAPPAPLPSTPLPPPPAPVVAAPPSPPPPVAVPTAEPLAPAAPAAAVASKPVIRRHRHPSDTEARPRPAPAPPPVDPGYQKLDGLKQAY